MAGAHSRAASHASLAPTRRLASARAVAVASPRRPRGRRPARRRQCAATRATRGGGARGAQPGGAQGEREREAEWAREPKQRHAHAHPPPLAPRLQLEKVERLGDEAWAGVAAVDRTTAAGDGGGVPRAALLAAGDVAALAAFAAAGRSNHGEPGSAGGIVFTAAPFIIAWLSAGGAAGAFGADARRARGAAAATTALRAWLPFFPVAHALRFLAVGHPPVPAFVGVSAGVTLLLLVGWRVAAGLSAPAADAGRANKRGGVFEFLGLLRSLTTRW